jgi:hypothetical protein
LHRLFPILLFAALLLHGGSLDYLNDLRTRAGLPPFVLETHLADAAKNHSAYLQRHDASGHDETEGEAGFTGVKPWDRAVHAGYPARFVGENVSVGQKSLKESIDGLFGAIYHRFGFLSLNYDEIGVGVSEDSRHFTYDMGNAGVRRLCEEGSDPAGSYYTGVCADENRKVDAEAFLSAMAAPAANAPDAIFWPAPGASDIPPAFYEESPDPLPDHGVTGYPVSVQFNETTLEEAPEVTAFTLADADGRSVEILTLMDADNDPNGEFSGYQFALFPKRRLEWGHAYTVSLAWRYEGGEYAREWCFATRSLAEYAQKVYRVESDDISLDAVSGVTYALYMVPEDTNDAIYGYRVSYDADSVSVDFIDQNTFAVTLRGGIGEGAEVTFSDGRKVTLTLSASDGAAEPAAQACPAEGADDTTATDETTDDTTATDDGDGTAAGGSDTEGTGTAPSTGTDTEAADAADGENAGTGTQEGAPEPAAVVEVEDGDGVYRPVDGSYEIADGTVKVSVEPLANGRLRCRASVSSGTTEVTLPAEGALVRIDNRRTTVVRAPLGDLVVTIHADGTLEMRSESLLLPETSLPAGTTVEIGATNIRTRIPLAGTLRF